MPAIRAFRPTTLQIFCAIGFFYGVTMFVHASRQRRKRTRRSDTRIVEEPNLSRDLIAKQNGRPPVRSLKVIPLSPDPRPVNVSNMTQQQKITAALLKAGSSNSPSWYHIDLYGSESSPVKVITAPPTPSSDNEATRRRHADRDPAAQPGWKTNLMLMVSACLSLLSLYFFLKSLR